MGREIRWSCSQHGIGKVEIIAQVETSDKPITPVERELASGKPYSICGKTIQARFAAHAYDHCFEPSCDQVYPLSRSCSGFVAPRKETTGCVLATRQWKCLQHDLMRDSQTIRYSHQLLLVPSATYVPNAFFF